MKLKLADRLLLALGPRLAVAVIHLLTRTMRLEYLGMEFPQKIWAQGERLIFMFWHDQLLLMVKAYQGPGARILISSSKDGELIARTMERFGHGAIRGSSHRGGRAAFRDMLEVAKQPYDFGITPDGPRGPRHQLKDGVVQLARLTGRPVIPLAFVCNRGYRFKSWDRFLLPFPFSRAVFSCGPEIRYRLDESPDEFRERLQSAMDANLQQATAHLGRHGVSAV